LRLEVLLVAIVYERVEIGLGDGVHVAAAPAVAAVRPAELDELLAPEADAPGAAVTGFDEDLGLVEELHGSVIPLTRSLPLATSSSRGEVTLQRTNFPLSPCGRGRPRSGGVRGFSMTEFSSNKKGERPGPLPFFGLFGS